MTRHVADRRAPSDGSRVKEFLRITRSEGSQLWQGLWRRPQPVVVEARRTAEFVRIERGQRA